MSSPEPIRRVVELQGKPNLLALPLSLRGPPVQHSDDDDAKSGVRHRHTMDLSGSTYDGERFNGRMHGKGTFTFANGNYYVGDFKDGEFDGEGILYIKDFGQYAATWSKGIVIEGQYTFRDGLLHDAKQGNYCTGYDRRFYNEILHGVKPAGQSNFENKMP
ncbi:hypothetical protein PROFUN_04608 [Planoprotostelium fungivorum]|uniref:MORN repeat-containing protein 5 n=1 Tax=Planoprotostelium fungivorum TaxID=1890364 RepID=A0A2P6NUE7_9EUKA|nr:hypothetical protein PROFUN_04608 [Planoprotostelium fungivorum]